MKKLLIAAICFLPVAVIAQNKFTVEGKVGTLNAPAKAYLFYIADGSQVTDSASITDGKFMFTGALSDITRAAVRIKHDTIAEQESAADGFAFYLEPKTIQLVSASDSVKQSTIKGSAVNDDNEKYKTLIKPVMTRSKALSAEFDSKTPEERKNEAYLKTVQERDEANQKEFNDINKQFYMANRDSFIGLVAYRNTLAPGIDPSVVEPDFNKFSAEIRATALGKNIAEMIAAAKMGGIGQLAADFTQNDVNDKPVKLSDFRGKYVLLDFWASWCGPCRQENPNVVAVYNAYKDKNFTVLGVSLDRPGEKANWLEAIQKDGLTWTHVSDLQWWNNAVARKYGIRSIPANYLIDPNGKIIAKNIRGEELQKKLAEVLGSGSSK